MSDAAHDVSLDRTELRALGADLSSRVGGGNGGRTAFTILKPWVRNGSPEVKALTFSFVPLTDSAPFIIAHAKGWFREAGIESTLRRERSWTALRDSLNQGTAHAAHILFSMPLAAACGLLGEKQKPLIVPWVLNRNGQGITLINRYKDLVNTEARPLRPLAINGRDCGRPLVFGHTLRVGTHALWLRYWLAAGGIHPDNDVALITVPPPQMVSNMRSGRMDGFCVGEPWNARAVVDDLGFTAIASQEIWPDHPEKVCAFTEEFAADNPRSVIAVLKALYRAGAWLDDPANHDDAATTLAAPEYLNCDMAWIRSRLGSEIEMGAGRRKALGQPMTFARRAANRPRSSHATWFLSQLRRWGLHFGVPDYEGVASRVMRPEFYDQTLSELGVVDPSPADGPETLCDGKVFDPSDPEGYARSFDIKNLQG